MTTERQIDAPSEGQGVDQPSKPPRRRASRRGRVGIWVLSSFLMLLLVFGAGILAMTDRAIRAPDWVKETIEERLTQAIEQGAVEIGDVSLTITLSGSPKVRVSDVLVSNDFGAPVLRLDNAEAQLAPVPLIRGRPELQALSLRGGALRIRRISDGTFDLAVGPEGDLAARGTLGDVLEAIEEAFRKPALAGLSSVQVFDVGLRFEDDLARRVFRIEGGRINFTRPGQGMALRLGFDLHSGDATSRADVLFETKSPKDGLDLTATLDAVRLSDFATSTPALAWARTLTASVSGAARLGLDAEGKLKRMNATVALGDGSYIAPKLDEDSDERLVVRIEGGEAIVSLNPDRQRLDLELLEVATSMGRMAAQGHVFVSKGTMALPEELVGQVQIKKGELTPLDLFSETVEISEGAVDLRLKLDPMQLDIGQASFDLGEHDLAVKGGFSVGEEGWSGGVDLAAETLSRDGLMAFWPLSINKVTRAWIADNMAAAEISNVDLALRWLPGQLPIFAAGFEFEEGAIRFLKTLPSIEKAEGRGAIHDQAFTLTLDRGELEAPNGDRIVLKDSLMTVPSLRVAAPPAEFELNTESSITAALSLLDEKPFEFLQKGGMATDLFQGRAHLKTVLKLPLANEVGVQDVEYAVTGEVLEARSAKLIPEKTLVAQRLGIKADPEGIAVSGPAKVGAASFSGSWSQRFGEENRGVSSFEGQVSLDEALVSELNLGLPEGSFTGEGTGRLRLDMRKGAPVQFELSSDLNRLGLKIPVLGWSKARNQAGKMEVAGILGEVPRIDRLSLDAAGLKADGQITVREGGGLKVAKFSRVAVGGWLDAGLTLTGRGKGKAPAVALTGGTVDIRKTALGTTGGGGANGTAPISLDLNRLQVSDSIAITGFKGDLSQTGGLSGQFTGQVNGKAAIRGTLAPGGNGTALRIRSSDAGAVLAAAGVLKNVKGGEMDLVLTPRETKGSYQGRLDVANTRLVGASAMAELLNAISVVGLLDQLNGPGIQFATVEADFVLSPSRVTLSRSAAVGPSMGITLDGIYDLLTEQMDMQGVVSPIYALNGIGQIFTRRGEGLFGFNFRLIGPAADPQVQVNPLSILTPGMFREIFRKPPPKVQN